MLERGHALLKWSKQQQCFVSHFPLCNVSIVQHNQSFVSNNPYFPTFRFHNSTFRQVFDRSLSYNSTFWQSFGIMIEINSNSKRNRNILVLPFWSNKYLQTWRFCIAFRMWLTIFVAIGERYLHLFWQLLFGCIIKLFLTTMAVNNQANIHLVSI